MAPAGDGRGDGGGGPMIQRIWFSSDFKRWKEFGRLVGSNNAGARVVVPLAGGTLFVAKGLGLHRSGSGYSPMYIVKREDSGELRACGNVELDFGPMYSGRPGAPEDWGRFENLVYNRRFQVLKNLLFELPSTLFPFEGGFLLGSAQLGVFWQFDAQGRLKRRMQVFARMEPEDFTRIFEFERAVVHAQMGPDASMLIGARAKEAVWFNQRFFPSGPAVGVGTPRTAEGLALNEERSRELNPDIAWYRLDPEEGEITPVVPPFGTPVTVKDVPRDCRFWFGFEWDGSIRYQGGKKAGKDDPCGIPAIPPQERPLAATEAQPGPEAAGRHSPHPRPSPSIPGP